MLNADNGEKLKDILNIPETNFQRLNFAFSRTEKLLPFCKSTLQNLEPEQISYIDQYIFHFAKIQDMMGEKLFRRILEAVEEETDSLAFKPSNPHTFALSNFHTFPLSYFLTFTLLNFPTFKPL